MQSSVSTIQIQFYSLCNRRHFQSGTVHHNTYITYILPQEDKRAAIWLIKDSLKYCICPLLPLSSQRAWLIQAFSAALKWRGRVVCKQTVVQLSLRRGMYINTPPRSESEPHCSLSIPIHLNTKDAFGFQPKLFSFSASVHLSKKKTVRLFLGLINALSYTHSALLHRTPCALKTARRCASHYFNWRTNMIQLSWVMPGNNWAWLTQDMIHTNCTRQNDSVCPKHWSVGFYGDFPGVLMMNTLVLISDWASLF